MKTFEVHVPAPTTLVYQVQADSADDALEKIGTGRGDGHPDVGYLTAIDCDPEWDDASVTKEVK